MEPSKAGTRERKTFLYKAKFIEILLASRDHCLAVHIPSRLLLKTRTQVCSALPTSGLIDGFIVLSNWFTYE